MRHSIILVFCVATALSASCQSGKKKARTGSADVVNTQAETVNLPEPYATKSSRSYSDVIGWPEGKTPVAPAGFTVKKFAGGLHSPRWICVAPNGDIFVSEATNEQSLPRQVGAKIIGASKAEDLGKSPDKIFLLRDADGDGVAEVKEEFITEGLNQPLGMLIANGNFYVANTDGILMYPYTPGQTKMTAQGKKILDLPAQKGQRHYARNITLSKDGKKILVLVGSFDNAGEKGIGEETRRADILEINLDGSGEQVYASGLRNPQGAGYAPGSNTLYTAVNERDELGDELVPDYLTSVKRGGFYGWPYSYWGQHIEPRLKPEEQRPDLVKTAIVPDLSLGSHTASLGLAFDEKNQLPGIYKGGAFIGQHGSWNRSVLSGYKVVFVPFANGKISGLAQDFLTGFIADLDKRKVYGRPVGVAFRQNGMMLVADDAGNTIWSVSAAK